MVRKRCKLSLNTGNTLRKCMDAGGSQPNQYSYLTVVSDFMTGSDYEVVSTAKHIIKNIIDMFPTRDHMFVEYSLNKHGRWDLPDHIKSLILMEWNNPYIKIVLTEGYTRQPILYNDRSLCTAYYCNRGPTHYSTSNTQMTLHTAQRGHDSRDHLSKTARRQLKKDEEKSQKEPTLPTYHLHVALANAEPVSYKYRQRSTCKEPRKKKTKQSKFEFEYFPEEAEDSVDLVKIENSRLNQPIIVSLEMLFNKGKPRTRKNKKRRENQTLSKTGNQFPSFSDVLVNFRDIGAAILSSRVHEKHMKSYSVPAVYSFDLSAGLSAATKHKQRFYVLMVMKQEGGDVNWCRICCVGDKIAKKCSAITTFMEGVVYDLPTLLDLAASHGISTIRKSVQRSDKFRAKPKRTNDIKQEVAKGQVNTWTDQSDVGGQAVEVYHRKITTRIRQQYERKLPGYQVTSPVKCGMCHGDMTDGRLSAAVLPCQHRFCNMCWHRHIHTNIHKSTAHISCLRQNCETLLDPAFIMSMVDFHTYMRFELSLKSSFK